MMLKIGRVLAMEVVKRFLSIMYVIISLPLEQFYLYTVEISFCIHYLKLNVFVFAEHIIL